MTPPNLSTRPRRRFHTSLPTALWLIGAIILAQLAFWGGVIYVAVHFLLKWW